MKQKEYISGAMKKSKVHIFVLFIVLAIIGLAIAQIIGADTQTKSVTSQRKTVATQTNNRINQPLFNGEIRFTP